MHHLVFLFSSSCFLFRRLNFVLIELRREDSNFFMDIMDGAYTEETLTTLNKSKLIDLFLKSQEKTENTINSLMKKSGN